MDRLKAATSVKVLLAVAIATFLAQFVAGALNMPAAFKIPLTLVVAMVVTLGMRVPGKRILLSFLYYRLNAWLTLMSAMIGAGALKLGFEWQQGMIDLNSPAIDILKADGFVPTGLLLLLLGNVFFAYTTARRVPALITEIQQARAGRTPVSLWVKKSFLPEFHHKLAALDQHDGSQDREQTPPLSTAGSAA